MGSGLAKLNDLKNQMSNTVSALKGEEPETGYLGSPQIKFPSFQVPLGCKTLDIRANQGKIPEVLKVIIYECLDELKNDGSYRFSGAEITWKDKMSGQTQRIEHMSGEKEGCRVIEIGSLDYIKSVAVCKKEHEGQSYVSFCGVRSHLQDPAGAGDLKLPVAAIHESQNKEFTEGALGLRLVVHKKLKVIVDVIPYFARVADKKTKVDLTRQAVKSFFASKKEVLPIYGTKIYDYKAPENKYEDFSTYITNGEMRKEYMGGLPFKFLAPEEQQRLTALLSKLEMIPLIELLKKKGSLFHLKLDPAMEDKVVNFVVTVLEVELFSQEGSYEENIRFCMKMLCIVYNDDEKLWKRIQEKVGPSYKNIGGKLFEKAMAKCQSDNNLASVQKIENFHDEAVKAKYQKACPQCPDDGKDDDVEKIAKKYMMDAAQYLREFHSLFQSLFTPKKYKYGIGMLTKDTEYHGAPTVKGLDRIKAKAQEYQDKEKLSASDAIARTMDYLRGTVECDNLHEVIMAFNKLKKLKGDYKIVRIKNGFKDMNEKGFKSILLNIMIYNTQIAEVQITIGAFKEGNTLNHFIYEVLREHNLYDMVSKNLNLSTAFKEWLEPLAENGRHEIWPRNAKIHLKGFCIDGADDFWSAFETDKQRQYCNANFQTDKDYNLTGFFAGPFGQFKLREGSCKVKFPTDLMKAAKNIANVVGKVDDKAGKTLGDALSFGKKMMDSAKSVTKALGVDNKDENDETPTIEWRMYPWGPTHIQGHVGIFKGKFIDEQIIEGDYVFKPVDTMGNETQNIPLGTSLKKGTFRIWVDDAELPGLNTSALAFRDIMKTSRVIRKKYIPSKLMDWSGYLGGSDKKAQNEPLNLKMKINNPNNFPYNLEITGKGTVGKKKIMGVTGFHMFYDTISLNLPLGAGSDGCFSMSSGKNFICTGRFIEDLKVVGIYDDRGHFGRFSIECTDKDAIKNFGPRGENENGRWDLIIIYNDGGKQYNQITMKFNPDHTVAGSGFNLDGGFQIEGTENKKGISITRTQKNADGTSETITLDGMFITGGVYEGQFRSDNDWGKFKLRAC